MRVVDFISVQHYEAVGVYAAVHWENLAYTLFGLGFLLLRFSAKHREPAKKYCPRCGSPRMRLPSSLDYWLTPKKYVCENCGYMGPIVMELEKEKG